MIRTDIEELQNDKPTLCAIEERWGMWLKTLDIGKQREEILKLFDEFRDQILKDYSADKVILNESYLNSKC